MASKHFLELLEKLRETHIKKNADYANDENPFQNFERAAVLASWFNSPIDQVFASIIGIKLARLAELRSSGKTPNNESVQDSYVDLTAYCGLWAAFDSANTPLEKMKKKIDEVINSPIYDFDFPNRCSNCNIGEPEKRIYHAIMMHVAKLDTKDNFLIYPNNITKHIPDEWIQKYNDLVSF